MEGCGILSDCVEPDERVYSFSTAGEWGVACEPLHNLWESFTPVHQNLMRPNLPEDQRGLSNAEIAEIQAPYRVTGGGLGIPFASYMADALGKPIGLIPAAHGGTSLEQWSEKLKDQGGESLYGAMLERIKRANVPIKGILWYQGESDASPEWAPSYAERFDRWIAAVRRDLGNPTLPVIVVQLGCFVPAPPVEDPTWWDMICEALRTLPERTPYTAMTSAVDLSIDDCIHISTEGHKRLGRRLARLALRFEGRSDILSGPRPVRVEVTDMHYGMGALKLVCDGVTGELSPSHHMSGFQICNADGSMCKENLVMDARRDPKDPSSVRLILNYPPADGQCLAYGLGTNPYCNVVDSEDMSLPSFTPMKIG
jgi:sialate O-acetylesterase